MTEFGNLYPLTRSAEDVITRISGEVNCHYFAAATEPPRVFCELTRDGNPGSAVYLDMSQRVPNDKLREICRILNLRLTMFGLTNDMEDDVSLGMVAPDDT